MKKKELKNLKLKKRTIATMQDSLKGGNDRLGGFTQGSICDWSCWIGCYSDECGG